MPDILKETLNKKLANTVVHKVIFLFVKVGISSRLAVRLRVKSFHLSFH